MIPYGELWRDFVNNVPYKKYQEHRNTTICEENQKLTNTSLLNMQSFEIQHLASKVTDQVTEINEILRGKELNIIFDTTLSLNYPQHFKNIGILAINENQFKDFIASLYIIVFESTQEKITVKNGKKRIQNMAKYPACFNRYPKSNEPDIFHHINGLRHKFLKAHDTLSSNFSSKRFTPEESQEYFIGHRNRPNNNEFISLQKGILTEFSIFLSKLLEWANNQIANN